MKNSYCRLQVTGYKLMLILLTCNFQLVTFNLSAQIQKVWDKDLASSYVENPVFIYKNPSGTVDVISTVGGSGSPTVGNAMGNDVTTGYGMYDYWFCKLNKNGQKIPNSDFTYGGISSDIASAAIKTTDGGYLICGISSSGVGGNKTLVMPSYNGGVLWVVKIDSGGVLQWQQQKGFNASSSYDGEIFGNMAVCNTTNGYAIALSTATYGTQNSYATYFVGLDLSGNILASPNQIDAGYGNILMPNSIIQLSNGNILVAGKTGTAATSMLLTASGTVISYKNYTSSGACEIISEKELSPNGNWLFFAKSIHNNTTGFSRTINSKASGGNYDIWVFQTDNTGVIQANQGAIGCGSINLADHTNIKNYSNVSYSTSSAGPVAYLLLEPDATGDDRIETGKGGTDYWLVQYDYTNNVVVNENSFGGSGIEQVQSLYADGSNAYLLGTSASPISGDKTEALQSGTSDLWVVRTCLSTDIPVIANAAYISHPPFPYFRGYFVYPCSAHPYTLSVSNPNVTYTYRWYDAATGGNLLGTGTSYTIPSVGTANQNIWVEPDNGTCVGNRVAIIVSPLPSPATPTYSGSALVCSGSTLSLTGQMNTNGQLSGTFYKLHWYDSNMNLLNENNTFTLGNCQNPFILYLSVIDSVPAEGQIGRPASICESGMTTINVTIDNAPAPTVTFTNPACIYDPTTLSVTNASGYTVKWYNSSNTLIHTGNPFIYTSGSYSSTISCELVTPNGCASVRTNATITVQHVSPVSPSFLSTVSYPPDQFLFPSCSDYPSTITVYQPNSFYTYKWYDSSTGNLIYSGSSYTIPNVNYYTNYDYFVMASDGTCLSDSMEVYIDPLPTPGLPQITGPVQICRSDTLTLIAVKDTFAQGITKFFCRWYDASNNLLHTGDTLVVPNIQTVSSFYCSEVDSVPYNYFPNLGPYECEGQKILTQITVDSAPAPMVTYTDPTCIYNSTTLSIPNGSGYYVNWYNNAGNNISTGNPFIYTNNTNADTLYCTLTSGFGCISRKTQVIINVQHALPLVPVIQNTFMQSGTEFFPTCSNSSATLNIYLPNSSLLYDWYDAPTAGNIVNVGTSNTIPNVNPITTYEYWVSANDATCTGNRQDVKVQPIKTPGLPKMISTLTHICRYDTLILIANTDTSTQAGGQFYIRWYDASNNLLHTGDTLVLPNIQTGSTFYCSEVDSIPYNYFPSLGYYICEGQRISKQIAVDTVADPLVSVPSPACTGTNIPLTITNVVNSTIHWYSTTGASLGNGISYTIPFIQSTDTIYSQAVGTNTCKSHSVQTIVIPQKPLADFSSTKTLLNSGDVTQFNNLTIGGNTWYWDFGDGSYSLSQSPHHFFYTPGFYNITLIATSSVGCNDTVTKNNFIEVVLGNGINEYSVLNDVKVFPNPTSGEFQVSSTMYQVSSIEIYNVVGEKVYEKGNGELKMNNGQLSIDLSEVKSGIYFLQIEIENEIVNFKIIKE